MKQKTVDVECLMVLMFKKSRAERVCWLNQINTWINYTNNTVTSHEWASLWCNKSRINTQLTGRGVCLNMCSTHVKNNVSERVMTHLNRSDGDAGCPQQHAQSLQWWSTRQGLVSVPGMCIQMYTNTMRGYGGKEGWKRKKGEKKDPSNVVFNDSTQSSKHERADFNHCWSHLNGFRSLIHYVYLKCSVSNIINITNVGIWRG